MPLNLLRRSTRHATIGFSNISFGPNESHDSKSFWLRVFVPKVDGAATRTPYCSRSPNLLDRLLSKRETLNGARRPTQVDCSIRHMNVS